MIPPRPLTAPERNRLAGALSLLASTVPGEVLAAAAAVTRIVQARGTSWAALLAADPPRPRPCPYVAPSDQWRHDLTLIDRHRAALSEWESVFQVGMLQREKLPSLKQRTILAGVAGKLRAKGLT